MELLGYFTAKGRELAAKLLTGAALEITRVAAAGGETGLDAAALTGEKQELAVGPAERSGSTVTLPVTLAAALAEEDYTLGEVGVYARDPDEGEILYRLYRLEPAVNISAGGQLVMRLELRETVSDDVEVSIEGTATGLLTYGDLEALMGVPEGLATLDEEGIVPASQLPAMDYAAEQHSHAAGDVTSGTLAADRIPALDAGKITSGTLAAERIPTLDASKITGGTFNIARIPTITVAKGGTGATDAATARTNLGITPANIGAAASSHSHAAGNITSGTFAATGVAAMTGTDYTTARVRNIQASTTDLTAGSSTLANGNVYLVYE